MTLSGFISVDNITVEEGSPLISGTGLTLKQNAIVSGAGTLTFDSAISTPNNFTKSGSGALVFLAAQTFSGTLTVSGGTLSLTGTSSIGTLNITGDSVLDFGGTSNISVANLNIASGVVLTLQNYAGADTFNATTFKINGTTVTAGTTTTSIAISGSPGVGVLYGSGGAIGIVPEPATYGALFMASALGGFFWTRRRRFPV